MNKIPIVAGNWKMNKTPSQGKEFIYDIENLVPTIRNTKVIDLINLLSEEGCQVSCYDPWVDKEEVLDRLGIALLDFPANNFYEAIIVAVSHDEFTEMGGEKISNFGVSNSLIFDLKHILADEFSDLKL